jgi:Glycine zipper
MPDNSKPEKNGPRASENIQVPPIPKQTAGAVTGAAIGSIAGPVGAVVGGVVGAFAGKAASSERPVPKAVRRGIARSKGALTRQPGKKPLTKSRKVGGRRLSAKGFKRMKSRKSPATKAQKRTVRQPRKSTRSRQKSTSSRTRQKRSSGRTKRR